MALTAILFIAVLMAVAADVVVGARSLRLRPIRVRTRGPREQDR
jgi:hypothetical protein